MPALSGSEGAVPGWLFRFRHDLLWYGRLFVCLAALIQLGVPDHKIRREIYGPPANVTKEPGWPEGLAEDTLFDVDVLGARTIQAPAGEPLLNTLERFGIIVPAICRSGACSACRVRLLSGRVFQPAHTGLRESDRQHGHIHACVSYPSEDCRFVYSLPCTTPDPDLVRFLDEEQDRSTDQQSSRWRALTQTAQIKESQYVQDPYY